MDKKLTRSVNNRIVGGVCAGIAEYIGADPTAIRVLFAIGVVFTAGAGLLAYLACWFIMPPKSAV
jgi:phage shock protein C